MHVLQQSWKWVISQKISTRLFLVSLALLPLVIIVINVNLSQTQSLKNYAATANSCGLANPVFCDTFTTPSPGGRGGDLDETKWNVSRLSLNDNGPQGFLDPFYATSATRCGSTVNNVLPDSDSSFCTTSSNQPTWNIALNDNGSETFTAFQIRQEFDFSQGNYLSNNPVLAMNVDPIAFGNHSQHIEIWLTDAPIPAPHGALLNDTINTNVRNGIGLSFNSTCQGTPGHQVTVDSIDLINNYNENVLTKSNGTFHTLDNLLGYSCINTQANVPVYIEVRYMGYKFDNQVEVWVDNHDGQGMVRVFNVDDFTYSLSHGYLSIEQVSNNAAASSNPAQFSYHFTSVGFDGPQFPLEKGYDIPDALQTHIGFQPGMTNAVNLGYIVDTTGAIKTCCDASGNFLPSQTNFVFGNVDLTNAQTALLTFNIHDYTSNKTFSYHVNNGPTHTLTYPFPTSNSGWRTMSLQVPLNELQTGTNTLFLLPSGQIDLANIGLTIQPVGVGSPPPTPQPTTLTTPSPTPTLPPGVTPSVTPTPTITPTLPPTGSTLGLTTVGGLTDSAEANNMEGSQVRTGGTAAPIVSMSVHVGAVDTTPNNQYQMAIYTDNAGKPGTLVAQTATGTLTANSWNTLSITANLQANTNYWLLYNNNGSNGNVNNMHYQNASSSVGVYAGQTFGSWPQTYPATAQVGAWQYSIYASLAQSTTLTPTSTLAPTRTPTPIPPTPTRAPTPIATATPVASVPGDINGDGQVDVGDLSILADNFGLSGGSILNSKTDINGDGRVDVADLSILADHFGQ